MRFSLPALLLLQLLAWAALCSAGPTDCAFAVKNCDPSKNIYFDNPVSFHHSKTIANVTFHNTYVVVDMKWSDYYAPNQKASYVLVRCGCPSPNLGPGFVEIFVPVRTAVIQQTVTIPKLVLIGQRTRLAAVESADYITTQEVLDDITNGNVVNLNANYTLLTEPSLFPDGIPDVIITGSSTSMATDVTGWTPAMEARRLIDTDAGEASPLGRAELTKLYGLIFGVQETANAIFDSIDSNYAAAVSIAQAAKRRPSVMIGVPYGGAWAVTRGSSYWGIYLKDANAEYSNSDDSLPVSLSIPQYVSAFSQTQFWINALYYSPTGAPMTSDSLISGNYTQQPGGDKAVFANLVGFACGNVFAYDKQVSSTGGNPFFELGVVRPDWIIADLVRILHPEAAFVNDQSELHFYRQLTPLSPSQNASQWLQKCPLVQLPQFPSTADTVYVTRQFLACNISSAAFDNALFTVLKPRVSSAISVGIYDFELYVSTQTPPQSSAQHCLYFFINIPSAVGAAEDTAVRLDGALASIESAVLSVAPSASVSPVTAVYFVHSDQTTATYAQSSSGLSKGAIAGIVIGSVAFVVILAIAARLAFRAGSRSAYEEMELLGRNSVTRETEHAPRDRPHENQTNGSVNSQA